jgi:HAD superfamily hydrolase (TIGR01549 family)
VIAPQRFRSAEAMLHTVLCVLFDVDDTLYDHTFASQAALRSVTQNEPGLGEGEFQPLLTANLRILENLHPAVVEGRVALDQARVERFRMLLTQFGGDVERAPALAEDFRVQYQNFERLVPGVDALLPHLRRFGVKMGIVSNNTLATQEGKLARLGIDQHFEDLVVSAEHGISKPDPRLFSLALKRIGSAAADTVYVGDRWELDVVGARSAGVAPIWFNRFGLEPGDGGAATQLSSFKDRREATAVILDYGSA